jgi:hypothetical protein
MRKRFPCRMLVLPALPVGGIYGLSYIAERMGHHWNLHGNGIDVLVFLSWILAPVIVAPIQAIAVAIALPRLLKNTVERTLPNFLVTGFAIVCIVALLALMANVIRGSTN